MKDKPENEDKTGKVLRTLCFVGRCIMWTASIVYRLSFLLLLIIVPIVYIQSQLENQTDQTSPQRSSYLERKLYERDCEDMGAERAELARELRRRLDLEPSPEVRMDIARQLRELCEAAHVMQTEAR